MLSLSFAMLRRTRVCLLLASVLATALGSGSAWGQSSGTSTTTTTPTTTTCSTLVTTPTITTTTDQTVPERYVNGVDEGTATRPAGLTQTGISYQDCIDNMVLQFRTIACGFTGAYNLEAWASAQSDCTNLADRETTTAVCWPLGQTSVGLVAGDTTENYNIRVRDIVGPMSQLPSPTTYVPQGVAACSAQSTFLAVPLTVNFLPIDSNGNYYGSGALQFTVNTDMVGPPAPALQKIGDGDTLFVVNWTANVDTDTAGYDVVIDPLPGQADAAASSSGSVVTKTICPEGGASTAASDAESVSDVESVSDAESGTVAMTTQVDATLPANATSSDAGCYTIMVATGPSENGNGGTCNDPLLSGGTVVDGGTDEDAAIAPPIEEFDEAGDLIDSGVPVATGSGGIWTPPAGHIINPNGSTTTTVSGETNSTYTITGLTNGTTYTVVVAAVDNYGNIGPPSIQQCDYPAPVNDFWKIYRTDGGQAGGGFCALEVAGAPAGSTVAFAGAVSFILTFVRRRRRTKR
jgi:hypothetical protein